MHEEQHGDLLNPDYRLLSTTTNHPPITLVPRREEPARYSGADLPAPGQYYESPRWDKPGVRILPPKGSPRKKVAPVDVPYYEVTKSWQSPRAPTIRGRQDVPPLNRLVPGPASYCPNNDTIEARRAKMATVPNSTFGSPHRRPRPAVGPGPAEYAPVIDGSPQQQGEPPSPRKQLPGAIITGRTAPLAADATPGPGEYHLPSFVDGPSPGRLPITLKGRLPHPMDAKRIDFESAKTSHPRRPDRPMRAKPRL